MPLANRKRVILLKMETTYGVDPVPDQTNAVLCSNLDFTPLDGSSVERDFVRQYFGASGSVRVENFCSITFETEIGGAGSAGTAPQWGPILRMCNFTQTLTAAAITGTATAGTTTTITLAAGASSVDDFYTGMTLTITAGAQNGAVAKIIGYNGTTKVATIGKTLAGAMGATSAYSIGANALYKPNSDFGTATASTSATIYFNIDGVRHAMRGARGNVSFDLSAKSIPKMKWRFVGLYVDPSDVALPTTDYTGWQIPATVSTGNTTDLNLLGYSGAVYENLNFDIGNNLVYRQLVGAESVLITDRKPVGSVSIEATTIAAKDWWTFSKNSNTGPFVVKHGQTAGNIVSFVAQKAQLADPKYTDSDGVAMMEFGLSFIPYGSTGNDDIRICVE